MISEKILISLLQTSSMSEEKRTTTGEKGKSIVTGHQRCAKHLVVSCGLVYPLISLFGGVGWGGGGGLGGVILLSTISSSVVGRTNEEKRDEERRRG